MERVGIGIIGCGNISEAYLKAAKALSDPRHPGVADVNAGSRRGARRSNSASRRGASTICSPIPTIEIIVNLTIPDGACRGRACRALEAGKHVHSEKPLGVAVAEAQAARRRRRRRRGLRVGCAPDTFLGGAHQTCRKLIDDGAIGTPRRRHAPSSCAPATSAGTRARPSTIAAGGGPMLDMGPYYITALVNLLGPVARVAGRRDARRAPSGPSPASR